jgi:hypothetical protein
MLSAQAQPLRRAELRPGAQIRIRPFDRQKHVSYHKHRMENGEQTGPSATDSHWCRWHAVFARTLVVIFLQMTPIHEEDQDIIRQKERP